MGKERVKDLRLRKTFHQNNFLIATYQDMFAHQSGLMWLKEAAYFKRSALLLPTHRSEDHRDAHSARNRIPRNSGNIRNFYFVQASRHDGIPIGGLNDR